MAVQFSQRNVTCPVCGHPAVATYKDITAWGGEVVKSILVETSCSGDCWNTEHRDEVADGL